MRSTTDRIFDGLSASSDQSAVIAASQMFSCSVSVVLAGGTNAGAVKLQASNEPVTLAGAPNSGSWVDISGATVNTNGATSVMIAKTDVCYQWLRVVYTKASGSGSTIAVDFHANGV